MGTLMKTWLKEEIKMTSIQVVSQLFVKGSAKGLINLLLAKITDDILLTCSRKTMEQLVYIMKEHFNISKSRIWNPMNFNGCKITRREH